MSETNNNTAKSNDYLESHLPPMIIDKIQAGAFRSLCTHLRDRSDEVQNIDLMTLSGFCRNCLAKWMVLEARKVSDSLIKESEQDVEEGKTQVIQNIIQSLNALGYDEAAQYVYGTNYSDWKKAHSKKATDEQMDKFNNSKALWAKMEKELLPKRSDEPGSTVFMKDSSLAPTNKNDEQKEAATETKISSLLSNVCCTDVDDKPVAECKLDSQEGTAPTPSKSAPPSKKTRQLPPYQPPEIPSSIKQLSLGILTVSDRASTGSYETGDLSGPAVEDAVTKQIVDINTFSITKIEKTIVPDDIDAIQSQLLAWVDALHIDLIFTTGGTGFAKRDITPEATIGILDRECPGLVSFCTMECSKLQPLASLSRGTAGVRNSTLIVNLPGNPKGVGEIIPILFPLALHAIEDIKQTFKIPTTTTVSNVEKTDEKGEF